MEKICRNCKHWDCGNYGSWTRKPDSNTEFPCRVLSGKNTPLWPCLETYGGDCHSIVESIDTDPNFGCNRFEPLDEDNE